jgi:hypothetical protein
MKEPQRIRLTDFVSSQKEPNKLPLKSLQDEYDMITTIEGARILVKKDEDTKQNDS